MLNGWNGDNKFGYSFLQRSTSVTYSTYISYRHNFFYSSYHFFMDLKPSKFRLNWILQHSSSNKLYLIWNYSILIISIPGGVHWLIFRLFPYTKWNHGLYISALDPLSSDRRNSEVSFAFLMDSNYCSQPLPLNNKSKSWSLAFSPVIYI